MRKTGYFLSFFAVTASLALTVVSQYLPEWIRVESSKLFPAQIKVSYGLYERCEAQILSFPRHPPGGKAGGGFYNYSCQRFPGHSECDRGYGNFCTLWSTAGYASQMSVVFAVVGLVAILVAGVSRSRRKSLWKIVATLVSLRAVSQIAAMSLIVQLWRTWDYPGFEYGNLSISFFLNLASWIFDIFISLALVITGLAADAGHTWAAGRRAYRRIPS